MKQHAYQNDHNDALLSAVDLYQEELIREPEEGGGIRREMNQFLIQLHRGQTAGECGRRIHHLYLALVHLDNVERALRRASGHDELIQLERIHGKIRHLRRTMLSYIRLLNGRE